MFGFALYCPESIFGQFMPIQLPAPHTSANYKFVPGGALRSITYTIETCCSSCQLNKEICHLIHVLQKHAFKGHGPPIPLLHSQTFEMNKNGNYISLGGGRIYVPAGHNCCKSSVLFNGPLCYSVAQPEN